jgi:hypothetical protein
MWLVEPVLFLVPRPLNQCELAASDRRLTHVIDEREPLETCN